MDNDKWYCSLIWFPTVESNFISTDDVSNSCIYIIISNMNWLSQWWIFLISVHIEKYNKKKKRKNILIDGFLYQKFQFVQKSYFVERKVALHLINSFVYKSDIYFTSLHFQESHFFRCISLTFFVSFCINSFNNREIWFIHTFSIFIQ